MMEALPVDPERFSWLARAVTVSAQDESAGRITLPGSAKSVPDKDFLKFFETSTDKLRRNE